MTCAGRFVGLFIFFSFLPRSEIEDGVRFSVARSNVSRQLARKRPRRRAKARVPRLTRGRESRVRTVAQ